MNRLTDDQVADGIKTIVNGLIAAGAEPAMSDRRYIRLAEYESTGFTPEELNELYRRVNGAVNVLLRGKVGRLEYRLDLSEPTKEEESGTPKMTEAKAVDCSATDGITACSTKIKREK